MNFWTPSGAAAEVVEQARAWLDGPEDVPVLIATSGSTGTPKQVVLTKAAVLASVRASAARLGATGPWVLALPATYVAGLQVVVRSLVAGHPPTVLDWAGWPEGEGWFVSLVPTQLQRMLSAEEDLAALRRAGTVLLGGGPVGAALRERASAAGVRVVATYGSAETAGGCVYDGVPLDGVAVAIGEGGRIRVAGPTLFSGYAGQDELTREVLVDGWFHTSDAGRIDEDGRLVVLGRVDDVIVTGGLNVPGPAVAARLRQHPAVAECEVLGVPDPEWGNRVVAFVVPATSSEAEVRAPGASSAVEVRAPGASSAVEVRAPASLETSLEALRDWVAAEHPRAWAPREVVVLEEIPMLPNGKPDRVRLRGLVAS